MFRLKWQEIKDTYNDDNLVVVINRRYWATLLAVSNETLSYRATWEKPDNETFDEITNMVHKGMDSLMSYKTLDDIFNLINDKWNITNSHLADSVLAQEAINSTLDTKLEEIRQELENMGSSSDLIANILEAILTALGGSMPATLSATSPYLLRIFNVLDDMNSTGDARTITDALGLIKEAFTQYASKPSIQYLPKEVSDNQQDFIANGAWLIGSELPGGMFKADHWLYETDEVDSPQRTLIGGVYHLGFVLETVNSIRQTVRIPAGYSGLELRITNAPTVTLEGALVEILLEGEVVDYQEITSGTEFTLPVYGFGGDTLTIRLSVWGSSCHIGVVELLGYPVGINTKEPIPFKEKDSPIKVDVVPDPVLWQLVDSVADGATRLYTTLTAGMQAYLAKMFFTLDDLFTESSATVEYTLELHPRAKQLRIEGNYYPARSEEGTVFAFNSLEFVHVSNSDEETSLVIYTEPVCFNHEVTLDTNGGKILIRFTMSADDTVTKPPEIQGIAIWTTGFIIQDEV